MIPGARILFDSLREGAPPELLMADLLAVELADGAAIDVGWHPPFDPRGRYRVAVLGEDGEPVGEPFETRDPREARAAVARLARSNPRMDAHRMSSSTG